jgi:hypothetical protein
MSYPGLGEFVWPESADWVYKIQYNERRPLAVRGGLNPWELERQRQVWLAEQAAWVRIQSRQADYRRTETAMRNNMKRYNQVLLELEGLTGQSIGSQVDTYGGMALAILPGFGWASAAWKLASMISGILSGKNKKIAALVQEAENLVNIMKAQQKHLRTLAEQIVEDAHVAGRVREEHRAVIAQELQRNDLAVGQRAAQQSAAVAAHRERMTALARQTPEKSVLYANQEGDL